MPSLPRKITPERIREAIVQLYFQTGVPFEPLVGYFYHHLTEAGFAYTNRQVPPKHFLPQGTQPLPPTFEVILATQHFFFNEKIRLQVQNDHSIVFNCMTAYPGWAAYFGEIKKAVNLLLEKEVVGGFNRIGLRYISEFPDVDILEKTNFTIGLYGLEETITNGTFRVEWLKDDLKYIVNLAAKLPIPPLVVPSENKAAFTSLIDIDVIRQDFEESQSEKLFQMIDYVHQKEKEQFYRLLKPDFLSTLNPEY